MSLACMAATEYSYPLVLDVGSYLMGACSKLLLGTTLSILQETTGFHPVYSLSVPCNLGSAA